MAISRAKNEERYSKKLYGGPGLFCSEIALFMLYVLLEKDLILPFVRKVFFSNNGDYVLC